jgi:hypothetical protein
MTDDQYEKILQQQIDIVKYRDFLNSEKCRLLKVLAEGV